MRHRLFAIASAISMMLCGTVVATRLFLQSGKDYKFYSAYHEYTFSSGTRGLSITILGGTRLVGGFGTPGKHWDSSWVGATRQLPIGPGGVSPRLPACDHRPRSRWRLE